MGALACPLVTTDFDGVKRNTTSVNYDHPVRHAIDFSRVADISKINLPEEFDKYRGFLYNETTRRISFEVGRNTTCVTRAKGTPFTSNYEKGYFYSIDPSIKIFDALFIKYNPTLTFSFNPKAMTQVFTYDFVDKANERAGVIYSANEFKKKFNKFLENPIPEFPTWLKWTLGISIGVVIVGGAWIYSPKKFK